MLLRGRTEGPESGGERPETELLILRMRIQGLNDEGTGKAFFFSSKTLVPSLYSTGKNVMIHKVC